MDLKTLLNTKTAEEREMLADACGTAIGHLRNVCYGLRPCSPELAVLIERHTAYVVRRWDLRPDDWHRIWPELIGAEGAPPVAQEAAHG